MPPLLRGATFAFGPRAVFSAMATACFWGLPAASSVLMLDEIASFEPLFIKGI